MIIAASNGQYGQSHLNVVPQQQQQRQNSINASNSSSSSSSLSPMRPSSSCSPISSSTSNSESSPRTTVVYSSSNVSYPSRTTRKSPNTRYHPYSVSSGNHIDYPPNGQFYAAGGQYYDQYSQTQLYSQPQQTGVDYTVAAAAVAANTMSYNPYTDQTYYYAAQNAAAASFLMQQTQHQYDSPVICAPNFTADNQPWKSEAGYYPGEGVLYSESHQGSMKPSLSSPSSPSSSSTSDSLSSGLSSPINSPMPSPGRSKSAANRKLTGPTPKKQKTTHESRSNGKNGVKTANKTNKSSNQTSSQLKSKEMAQNVMVPVEIVGQEGGIGEPKKRVSANKKERRRTQSINNAFTDLRNRIPQIPTDTKLSKIKTLKLAINYIEHLMKLLQENDPTSFEPFKPDLGKLRRECRSREIKQEVERKAKGRTGWPSEVWSTELKRKLNDNTNQSTQSGNQSSSNKPTNTSPSSINSSSSSSSLLSIPNGFNRCHNFFASTFGNHTVDVINNQTHAKTGSFLSSNCFSSPFGVITENNT